MASRRDNPCVAVALSAAKPTGSWRLASSFPGGNHQSRSVMIPIGNIGLFRCFPVVSLRSTTGYKVIIPIGKIFVSFQISVFIGGEDLSRVPAEQHREIWMIIRYIVSGSRCRGEWKLARVMP